MHYHCRCPNLVSYEYKINKISTAPSFCTQCKAAFLVCGDQSHESPNATITHVHAITLEARTMNARKGYGFFDNGLSEAADLEYRKRIAKNAMTESIKWLYDLFPILNENTLIAICFPEFFFRGGKKGYYRVSRDRDEDNTSFFNRRYRYALNIASELLTHLNHLMRELDWQSDSPPCVTICAGTVAIGTGSIDGEVRVQETSRTKNITVVDNYALILTFSKKMSKANIIYKRNTSKFDFLKSDLSDYGPGVIVIHHESPVRSVGRYATAINSFENLRDLYPSQKLQCINRTQPLDMPFLPSIVLLDGAQAPALHHIPNSPISSIPAFTIGTSICLDYLSQVAAEEQSKREELKRNLILYPSVGSKLLPQNPVNEAADHGIIIHADGGGFGSNVAKVQGGVLQAVVPSFDRLGTVEIADIVDEHKIFFTGTTTAPQLIYRGSTSMT